MEFIFRRREHAMGQDMDLILRLVNLMLRGTALMLGLVGAGGIGLPLETAITTIAWTQVSLILLIIIATVVVSEWVSAKVRHAII